MCFSGFVRASIDLAQEYAILGRMDRAGGKYAEALAALEDLDQSISNQTRVRLYLRFAEATVASGNTEEALVAYAKAQALAGVLAAEPVSFALQKTLHQVGTLEHGALASHAFSAIQASRVGLHFILFKSPTSVLIIHSAREILSLLSMVFYRLCVFGIRLQNVCLDSSHLRHPIKERPALYPPILLKSLNHLMMALWYIISQSLTDCNGGLLECVNHISLVTVLL
jgi:tetratricopeptide (TPR) repeat protein